MSQGPREGASILSKSGSFDDTPFKNHNKHKRWCRAGYCIRSLCYFFLGGAGKNNHEFPFLTNIELYRCSLTMPYHLFLHHSLSPVIQGWLDKLPCPHFWEFIGLCKVFHLDLQQWAQVPRLYCLSYYSSSGNLLCTLILSRAIPLRAPSFWWREDISGGLRYVDLPRCKC